VNECDGLAMCDAKFNCWSCLVGVLESNITLVLGSLYARTEEFSWIIGPRVVATGMHASPA
jgi:hypothetical protein